MKTNEELEKKVIDALNWEPLLLGAEIGVLVIDGIVTLTGSVNSYVKKEEAEKAVAAARRLFDAWADGKGKGVTHPIVAELNDAVREVTQ